MEESNPYTPQFQSKEGKLNDIGFQSDESLKYEALAHLPPLQSISLNRNNISDLHKILKLPTLTLTRLSLCDNSITDVSPLTQLNLNALKSLQLSANSITDIAPFSHQTFHNLQFLELMENKISDISQIKSWKIPNLSSLNLASNLISNLQPLVHIDFTSMPKVKIVIAQNPFSDQERQVVATVLNQGIMRVIPDWLV